MTKYGELERTDLDGQRSGELRLKAERALFRTLTGPGHVHTTPDEAAHQPAKDNHHSVVNSRNGEQQGKGGVSHYLFFLHFVYMYLVNTINYGITTFRLNLAQSFTMAVAHYNLKSTRQRIKYLGC